MGGHNVNQIRCVRDYKIMNIFVFKLIIILKTEKKNNKTYKN